MLLVRSLVVLLHPPKIETPFGYGRGHDDDDDDDDDAALIVAAAAAAVVAQVTWE